MKEWLEQAPKILLFTGKGGVGKTSLACASAIALADEGKKVLLVSTDPASNLDEVLNTRLSSEARAVSEVPGLTALNIDPLEAAHRYRERMVDPLRGILPEESLRNIEEQLSGACTVEIASFNEFTALIGDPDHLERYDHVVLDTAPTGHTLRLLSLPAAWNDFIIENKTGSSCLGPMAGLKDQRKVYEQALHALQQPKTTRVVIVSRPEPSALREAARAADELQQEKIQGLFLVINGVFKAGGSDDPLANAWEAKARKSLSHLPSTLSTLPQCQLPFHPGGLIGPESLRGFLSDVPVALSASGTLDIPAHLTLEAMVDQFIQQGPGVIMTMGKGGVGKTTIAAAIARALGRRGVQVHLSTTDPAAHIAEALGEHLPNVEVSRIDPREETRKHIEEVMENAGKDLDEAGRALLLEELRSPCTEEVAVFQAFARTVAKGNDQFVVLDTAPTGHTLLLLDASEAYHREVLRGKGELPGYVTQLLPKLRDPSFTRVLLVTLPEATPVHEAQRLQEDLRRAQIEPTGWVLNQSLAGSAPTDRRLQIQAQREIHYLKEASLLSDQLVIIPWLVDEPDGAAGLDALLHSGKS
ncbi:MAG: arsenical pump-driving ATPase [Kiritimatiellae bacterium]|jgi:arsenite-transporting ATPase|nr:arsenical pump-driving ATPase [Kiritimatiellia bacterium]